MIYDVEVRWKSKSNEHWHTLFFTVLADDQDDAFLQAEEKFLDRISDFEKENVDTYQIHDILPVLDEIR